MKLKIQYVALILTFTLLVLSLWWERTIQFDISLPGFDIHTSISDESKQLKP